MNPNFSKTQEEKLKSLRRGVDWDSYRHRVRLLVELDSIIDEWRGPLPYLRETFRGDEIDRLLTDSVYLQGIEQEIGERFIVFVARSGYKDQPELDENGNLVLQRTTALHLVARRNSKHWRGLAGHLFHIFNRFDANYSDSFGCTHFHVACQLEWLRLIGQFLDAGQHPDCLPRQFVDPPLHLVIRGESRPCALFERLLLCGADPNLPDSEGRAPLHAICDKGFEPDHWASRLIDICRQHQRPLNLDARDQLGRTPLQIALARRRRDLIQVLIPYADTNLADAQGLTPLHYIRKYCPQNQDLYWSFEASDPERQRVMIDARDKLGRTPLHWALLNGTKSAVESLLTHGANPNLADTKGSTPLHYICESTGDSEDLAIRFFEINDEQRQHVQMEAKNDAGLTPLQWAVSKVVPGVVEVLLKRGADLSSFVFPSKICFSNRMLSRKAAYELLMLAGPHSFACPPKICSNETASNANFKLRRAAGLMAIVESLENAGYELELSDALTIMESFSEHKVFEKSTSLVQRLRDDEEFEIEAKNIEIIQGLSLYDFIKLQPREAERQFTFKDCFKNSEKFFKPQHESYYEAFTAHLAEKLSRRFFLSWALEPFCELIHLRLPILCCDMIIANLPNEDLYNICKAATGQN